MPKNSTKRTGFYGVKIGRVTGVYTTWEECQQQTKGYPRALQKKFSTFEEATAFVNGTDAPAAQTKVELHQRHARATVPPQPGWQASSTNYKDPWDTPGTGANAIKVHRERGHMSRFGTTSEPSTSSNLTKSVPTNAVATDDEEWETFVVYTDGACKDNGKVGAVAGIGVWWGPFDKRNLSERCPGKQTNNRAELIAIIRALESISFDEASSSRADAGKKRRWIIRTDSKYSIKAVMEWAPKWVRNNWRLANGDEAKNASLIQYLLALVGLRRVYDEPVRFEHVRGHQGEVGNEGADQLAVQGTQQPFIPERNWAAASKRTERSTTDILWMQAKKKRPKQVESISSDGGGQPAEFSAEEEALWKDMDLTELLDFVVLEDDLLSPEEMALLEVTQDF